MTVDQYQYALDEDQGRKLIHARSGSKRLVSWKEATLVAPAVSRDV